MGLSDYLHYTNSERKGVITLIVLCVALFIAPIFYSTKDRESIDFILLQAQIAALDPADKVEKGEEMTNKNELFLFDPNYTSKADFMRLGLDQRTANSIVNYRNKGGKFFKKDDFKKIYTLKNDDFLRLRPFIQFKDNEIVEMTELVAELFPFDPNYASKTDFLKLGLNQRTAKSIINYRNKGGKFFKKDDFKKIYTLENEDFLRLRPFIQFQDKEAVEMTELVAESFPFDPNSATESDFLKLGLNQRTAKSIINYRNKGGKFFKKDDFKKIYTLEDDDYLRLEAFIEIEAEKAIENIQVDVNQATAEEWQKLPGIGPGYSKRIVGYREKLGGFFQIEQVKETYGLPDSVFQKIQNQLVFSSNIKKISINMATKEELKTHPYIKWKQADVIIQYRNNHGKFADLNALAKIHILTTDWIQKIKPYIFFE